MIRYCLGPTLIIDHILPRRKFQLGFFQLVPDGKVSSWKFGQVPTGLGYSQLVLLTGAAITGGTCPPQYFEWGGHNIKSPPQYLLARNCKKQYIYICVCSTNIMHEFKISLFTRIIFYSCQNSILSFFKPFPAMWEAFFQNFLRTLRANHGGA